MSHPADRNLLLGVLALQMDFITPEALLDAMKAWTFEKGRTLEQILVARGSLDSADLDVLRPLLDRHLARHGGDPSASIASLRLDGTSLEALAVVGRPGLSVDLEQTFATRSPSDPYATIPQVDDRPVDGHSPHLRYHRLRLHARGNLGEVFVAYDDELHREVALKQMKDRNADEIGSRNRFCFEAEVTGGLEHPGIVPVYGLGRYEDGRPYYAMRFIRGDSLARAIEAFHADGGRSTAGDRALSLRKWLRRFLDVCNAVAYAHSRGVLHRDLKPSNIMVGKYGETLVVDWGLARPFAPDGVTEVFPLDVDEVPLQARSGSSLSETIAGTVVGTPAYMPPEQAAGRLDQLGPCSDVYSLGATLYHLLAGRPPFRADSLAEVLRDVQRGDFPAPRAVDPSIPKALDAIARKAMALHPVDRYATPLALAADLEHWLADEPTSALPERRVDRAARWARNHRAASVSTALTLVAVAVAATLAAVLIAAAQRTTGAALDEARRANVASTLANRETALALDRARLAGEQETRARLRAQDEAEKARSVADFLVGLFEETDPLAAAGRSLGIAGDAGNALTAREVVDRGARALSGKFRDRPSLRAAMLDSIGNVYVGLGEIDLAEPLLAEALEIRRRGLPADPLAVAAGLHSLGWAREFRHDPSSIPLLRESLAIQLAAPGPDAIQVATTRFHLAMAISDENQGRTPEAMTLFRESLATFRAHPGRSGRQLAIQLILMAYFETSGENPLGAAPLFLEAAAIFREDGDTRLADLIGVFVKSQAIERIAGRKAAMPGYADCVEGASRAFGPDHIVTCYLRSYFADILMRVGLPAQAEAQYRINLEAARRLRFPDQAIGGTVLELARAVRDRGDPVEAEKIGREAIRILRGCPRQTRTVRRFLAQSCYIVGLMAFHRGDRSEEPILLLREALEIRKELEGPRDSLIAETYRSLGLCLEGFGRLDEAADAYVEALAIIPLNPGYAPGWKASIEQHLGRLRPR